MGFGIVPKLLPVVALPKLFPAAVVPKLELVLKVLEPNSDILTLIFV